ISKQWIRRPAVNCGSSNSPPESSATSSATSMAGSSTWACIPESAAGQVSAWRRVSRNPLRAWARSAAIRILRASLPWEEVCLYSRCLMMRRTAGLREQGASAVAFRRPTTDALLRRKDAFLSVALREEIRESAHLVRRRPASGKHRVHRRARRLEFSQHTLQAATLELLLD